MIGTMKKTGFLMCAAGAILILTQCTPTISTRGNIVQDDQLSQVHAGTDTVSDVLRKLGSPTTKAPFDDKIWYYFGQETEKKGILDPKITKERIVQVTFDDTGLVTKVEDVPPHRLDVPYVREKTPSTGNDITVMQQFLGNLGRFNKDGASKPGGTVDPGN